MARNKDLLRQKRREKDMRKKIIIGVIAGLVVIALVTALVLLVRGRSTTPDTTSSIEWDPNAGTGIVATIDGNKITEYEFMYYFLNKISTFEQVGGADIWDMDFDGETPENFAKQKTLEDIRSVKECFKRAKEKGLEPDEKTLTEAESYAEYYETFFNENVVKGKGLNKERIKEILIESEYSKLLFESYTADYVPDNPDYETELNRMITEETDYWVNKAVEEGDNEPFTEQELKEIADRVEGYYLSQLKNQYFETILSPWVENISIEINHEVYDKIIMADFAQQ